MPPEAAEGVTLVFMRHGETTWNREGRVMGTEEIPLSPDGRRQCDAAARLLSRFAIDRIVSSPQRRALETASIVQTAIERPLETDAGLEEVRFGDWQGKTYAEVALDPRYQAYAADPVTRATPGGETLADVQARGMAAIERVTTGETVLFVTHGDILRAILCGLLSMPLASYRRFRVDNCGLSAFSRTGEQVESKFVNVLADPERAWLATHWRAPA